MSFMFFILLFLCFMLFCSLLSYFVDFILSFDTINSVGFNWFVSVYYDYISCLILVMLLICFCYVWNYTSHYFLGDYAGKELNKIILLFVCVMASLVSTGDFLTTLIFWEYLGVVSYFLILFYGSYLSLRSSIVTLASSRFGDVALFLLISYSCYTTGNYYFGLIFVLLIVATKSATFPFISWLLEAMRAPTPVSSLVHSSTLVAAGVWFSIRYDFNLLTNNCITFSVLLLVTIAITGLCSFYFLDLKKIVALSTCNNIAWCIFYLLFGEATLSLFQLISHGVSKCMLFMLVGDVMSGSSGSQASNGVYSTMFYNNWNVFSLFCVICGLSGTPWIGVFFTKHFLLVNFMNISNTFLCLITLLCVFLSYFYSFRLCSIILNSKSSISIGVEFLFNSKLMVYFWLIVNFFLVLFLEELNYLSVFYSIMLIIFQFIACYAAIFMYNNTLLSNWSSSLFGCDNVVETFYNLYSILTNVLSIFFTRWDNTVLTELCGVGSISLLSYKSLLLNIIVFSSFWVLMCYIII